MSRHRRTPYTHGALSALLSSLPIEMPCMNPQCTEICRYRFKAQGRQPRFCSSTCRDHVKDERLRLTRALRALEDGVEDRPSGVSPAQMRQAIARVRWALDRYQLPQ